MAERRRAVGPVSGTRGTCVMNRAVGRNTLAVVLGLSVTLAGANCAADKFFFRDEQGNRVTLEARQVVFVRGTYVLETPDGRYHLVPRRAAEKREAAAGPAPLTATEFAARLQEEFSADLFRSHAQEPFLVGLVLAAPLPKTSEGQAKSLLREAAGFLNGRRHLRRMARSPAGQSPVHIAAGPGCDQGDADRGGQGNRRPRRAGRRRPHVPRAHSFGAGDQRRSPAVARRPAARPSVRP